MRNTKKITLPTTKFEVEIYEYITGGEKRKINDLLMSSSVIDSGTQQLKGEIPMKLINEANDLALSILVKSIDNSIESIVERIKELPSLDYDFLLKEINSITNNESFLTN